jgi:hypothetical protein
VISEPGSPKPLAKAVVTLAALVLVVGFFQLTRSGYSVDEEFTVFAVRGIRAHGIPLLPSDLLYDRGIAYSYASAAVSVLTGSELPAFRAISLLCGVLAIWLTFRLIAKLSTGTTGIMAASLVAISIPFWATATSGRFYAPFLAAFLAILLALGTLRTSCTLGTLCTIAVLSAVARWTHELAFLCAAIPVVCGLLSRGDRRRWFYGTIAVVSGLLFGQAVVLALHAAAPSSGETMVRRFFVWQVLNLFERPGDRQFLIPLVVMAIGWLIAPERRWIVSVVSVSLATMILAYSIALASNSAPLSGELLQSVLISGSRYPLDMFWHFVRTMPLTVFLAVAGLALRVAGVGHLRQGSGAQGGEWRFGERAAHALWIGWVLWFGVIESGITTNYLLLPTAFMLMAIAVDASAIFQYARVPALAIVLLLVAFDQLGARPLDRLEAARPTIRVDGIDDIRAGLQPSDRIACTDELGCLMLLGRIDRWLALDDYVRERFIVQRSDGASSGVYTGVPAVVRPANLFDPNPDGTLPDRVVIVDIFKDYPIGNSRSWLPRAIEEDGLRVTPLLETPQMRVLQVSTREQVAGRR